MSKNLFEHYCELYCEHYGGLFKSAANEEPKLELPTRAIYTLLGALAGLRLGSILGTKGGDENQIIPTLAGGTLGLLAPDIINVLSSLFSQTSKPTSGGIDKPKPKVESKAPELGSTTKPDTSSPSIDAGKLLEEYKSFLGPSLTDTLKAETSGLPESLFSGNFTDVLNAIKSRADSILGRASRLLTDLSGNYNVLQDLLSSLRKQPAQKDQTQPEQSSQAQTGQEQTQTGQDQNQTGEETSSYWLGF